jgi:small subunit ribosomal protein S17
MSETNEMTEQSGAGTGSVTEAAAESQAGSAQPPTDAMVADTTDAESVLAEVAATSTGRNRRKVREGLVVSDKMDKTVVVAVEDRAKHRLYQKVMTKTTRLKVHDEENTAGAGDRVVVMETRPMSSAKRWRLVTIVEKAK